MTIIRPAALGPRYWTALSIASVFGATLGDVLSHDLHLGHWRGVPPLLLAWGAIVHAGRRGWLNRELAYWSAVALVRAMATNIADLATHDAHLRQPLLLMAVVAAMPALAAWPRRTDGAHPTPGLPDTRGPYWMVLFLAGVLGTVLGDDASHRFGLATASGALGGLLGGVFVVRWLAGRVRVSGAAAWVGYWTTVVAARTAGTSVGDLVADHGGLGLVGSAVAEGGLLAILLLGWRRAGRRPGAPPLNPAKG